MYCNKLNVVHPGIIRRFQSSYSTIQLKNFCDLLGVPIHASEDRLKQAFYKKSLQYHPDRNPGNIVSAKLFAEINEAYQALLVNKRELDTRAGHNFSRRFKSKSEAFRQMHRTSDKESRTTSNKQQTWYAQAYEFTPHEERAKRMKFEGEIKVHGWYGKFYKQMVEEDFAASKSRRQRSENKNSDGNSCVVM